MDELDFVVVELQRRKGTWPAIERETGLDYSWLSKLARGLIGDPGIKKIARLARHFRLLAAQEAERRAQKGT